MIVIRSMEIADIAAVLLLEQSIPEAPHWKYTDYENRIQEAHGAGFFATEDALAGFAVARIVAGTCELESIAVTQEMRGKGVGQALLQAVMEWAVARGAERIELEVRAQNVRAIRLYASAGFVREGIRTRYYADPVEDALLMGRHLTNRHLDDGGKQG